jgi:hypothetical protein
MSGHKRKRCWFCIREGNIRTFKNRSTLRAHIFENHPEEASVRMFTSHKGHGRPNVVHYGARMRKKLGLEYSPSGHLRSTLEVA